MTTALITIDLQEDLVAKGRIDDIQDLTDLLQLSSYGDFTRSNFSTITTPITISDVAPSSPKLGEHWLDTSAAPYTLKHWTGTGWQGTPIEFSTTAPSSPSLGNLWYDTTLEVLRIYRTIDSLTGWHPIDTSMMLVVVENADTVVEGDLLQWYNGTSNRAVEESNGVVKSTFIAGVALEDFPTTGTKAGVMAGLGSKRICVVNCDESTHAILRGDYIASSDQNGHGRSVGAPPVTPYAGVLKRTTGVPFGAFARAMEDGVGSGSSNQVTCIMLDDLGRGMTVRFAQKTIADVGDTGGGADDFTYTEWDGAAHTLDLEDLPGAHTSPLDNSKHAPILGVILTVDAFDSTGAEGTNFGTEINFGSIVTPFAVCAGASRKAASGDWRMTWNDVFVPTDDGAGGIGSILTWSGASTSGGTPDMAGTSFYCTGYIA